MVLVGPRKHLNIHHKSTFYRRHSFSGSASASQNSGSQIEKVEPAVDIPVQFNFGSLYSSSLTVFFDFEDETGILKSIEKQKMHRTSLVQ
jgi:hypothetical protein